MPSISRQEGYRRGAGKEEAGLVVAEGFLRTVMKVSSTRIEGAEENYRLGDLRVPSGATIEVKRQGIDPLKYPENFVEVFEETRRHRHLGGFQELARLLAMPPNELAHVRVHDHRRVDRPTAPLGYLQYVSVSVGSMFGEASYWMYVNPGGHGVAHIYLYDCAEIADHVRMAVPNGLNRGMGLSNDDTFSVQIPLARNRWSAATGSGWSYTGEGDEGQELRAILATLGALSY
jgi:hypothetical protein